MVCNSSGSIIGPAGIVVEESRKAFAPGELASPERGFENQKGTVKSKRYRRACPAGAIFEGRGRPRKHRSTRASRVVAGWTLFSTFWFPNFAPAGPARRWRQKIGVGWPPRLSAWMPNRRIPNCPVQAGKAILHREKIFQILAAGGLSVPTCKCTLIQTAAELHCVVGSGLRVVRKVCSFPIRL
jgi:hypothetical protein